MSIDEWWYWEELKVNERTHTHYTTCTCIIPMCLCRLYASHGVYTYRFVLGPSIGSKSLLCPLQNTWWSILHYGWSIQNHWQNKVSASADKLQKKSQLLTASIPVQLACRNPEQNACTHLITASGNNTNYTYQQQQQQQHNYLT